MRADLAGWPAFGKCTMLLRRSPKRTRTLLAANRANSGKSTSPGAPLGHWHSALECCPAPLPDAGVILGQRSRTVPALNDRKQRQTGPAPVHTTVSVQTTRPWRSAVWIKMERTNLECDRNQEGSENMSAPCRPEAADARVQECERLTARPLLATSKRTKPECNRKEGAYKTMSGIERPPKQGPNGSGHATRLGRIFDAMRTAFTLRRQPHEVWAVRTDPECRRKEAGYKTISKSLGWLGAAGRLLPHRCANRPAVRAIRTWNVD